MSPQQISQVIQKGALTFLKKEYKVLSFFVIVVFALLYYFLSWQLAVSFIIGAAFSGLAGNIGMRAAVKSNFKTAKACQKNLIGGLKKAISGGCVMGLAVVGLGLIGITVLYYFFRDPQIIYGFGFGASAIALFARVGGGIYTKAADVGADLAGKVEQGIPEDDPRNPAVIADNVGDNVGDVAGMGADLFESYVDSIIAAMVLASSAAAVAVLEPLLIAGLGLIASLIGLIVIQLRKKGSPHKILNSGVFVAGFAFIISAYFLVNNLPTFFVLLAGLIVGVLIGLSTQYYTSDEYKPTQKLAQSAQTGAGTNVISGLALGMKSTIWPILLISVLIIFSYKLIGLYGIALAAVGMLSTLAITLSTDSYGPIVDNAAGIAEMSNMGQETRQKAEELDAVGNTTAAIGKGFAIGSAALTASVLAVSYAKIAGVTMVDLLKPTVLVALFIGGLLPFIFSSLTMEAVGKSAQAVIQEARRQFQSKNKPDYEKIVDLVTGDSLKQMVLPALLAIVAPIVIGFTLGKTALVGLLIGAIVTGFLMAVMMANAGGAWDNAKKFIEAGNFGGKGSPAHKAAVSGDTVGDSLKDCSGPSINILLKVMAILALIIAPLL